ncbi:MAG: recombinase family protein [Peptoniphilaceae bacterium]
MKAVIYARKSKASDKGESIENQIGRCKALCDLREWSYDIYVDYDVSGKDLDRPNFKKMMTELRNNKEDYIALICYKLDRISRSTRDFTNLREELKDLDISFISIKENFDLTTPMGKAMMSISSVFAELERETIAERVRDNMLDLAKKGNWNGGPTPFGYNRTTEIIEFNDRERQVSRLEINKDESKIIKIIFENYLKYGQSVRSTVIHLNDLGISTKQNKLWADNQVSRILKNAVYCIADENAYEYFKNNTKINIYNSQEEFDGQYGLLFYNRRKPHKKTTRERDESEWILAIGEHKGIISGLDFKAVQLKLDKNKSVGSRYNRSTKTPLIGLVRCGKCGSRMDLSSSRKSKNDKYTTYHYFKCNTTNKLSSSLCISRGIRADLLENIVIREVFNLLNNRKVLNEIYNNNIDKKEVVKKSDLFTKRNNLIRDLEKVENEINNLVNALAENILPSSVIKNKYEDLENKKNELKNEIKRLEGSINNKSSTKTNLDKLKLYIIDLKKSYYYLNIIEKKKLLKSIIKEVKVFDKRVEITIYSNFMQILDLDNRLCTDKDS